ncbi:MAG: hypothetical protein QOJ95_5540 [Mycobacterium sp.]|jgi:quinol monooxygenase YgiN|nr:hypothetical protein [Mycobacterium sp.]
MPNITANTSHTTLINVFTVAPERSAELAALLTEATEDVMQHLPGFVSASIHVSTDGTRVANYGQWESAEAHQAMLRNPKAGPHMAKAAEIAESFEPHLYTVYSVHGRG